MYVIIHYQEVAYITLHGHLGNSWAFVC